MDKVVKGGAPRRGASAKANAPENKAETAGENKRTVSAVERAAAGGHVGAFKVGRPHEGDQAYAEGDDRSGKVSELGHLVKTGTLVPADEVTADACSAWLGEVVEQDTAEAAAADQDPAE